MQYAQCFIDIIAKTARGADGEMWTFSLCHVYTIYLYYIYTDALFVCACFFSVCVLSPSKQVPQTGDGFLNFTAIRREHSGWYKCTSRHLNFQYSSIGYYLSIRCKYRFRFLCSHACTHSGFDTLHYTLHTPRHIWILWLRRRVRTLADGGTL